MVISTVNTARGVLGRFLNFNLQSWDLTSAVRQTTQHAPCKSTRAAFTPLSPAASRLGEINATNNQVLRKRALYLKRQFLFVTRQNSCKI